MDADLEIFSLKDSVWKLTTRVLILENFITQQFGTTALRDVHKRNPIVPATTTIARSRQLNRSSPNKRQHSGSSTEEQFSNNTISPTNNNQLSRIKRIASTSVNYNEEENSTEEYFMATSNIENDVTLLTPKNEVTEVGLSESRIDYTDMNFMDMIEEKNSQNAVVKTVMTEKVDATFLIKSTKSTPQSKSMQTSLSSKPSLSNPPLKKTEETVPQKTTNKKTRAKRSIVHLHYTVRDDGIFVCDHCENQYARDKEGGISHMLKHLRSKHPDVINESQKTD